MNIIVLCGGLSAERDVSLTSGSLVAGALRRLGHRAVLVDSFLGYTDSYSDPSEIFLKPYDDDVAGISEEVPDIEAVRRIGGQKSDSRIGANLIEICRAADIVFMALHGADGEDGRLQAAFDLTGIRYTGCGYLGSAIAMDKWVAKQLLLKAGINTPEGVTVRRGAPVSAPPFLPCVVKPRSGGSSIGTSIVNDEKEYGKALELAFEYEECAIVERYIKGRELDVGVIAGKALPSIEICPKSGFYDYKNKYQSGMTAEYCPADLPEETEQKLRKTAEDVFRELMLEVYARMDFIVDADGKVYCLEGNTLPGMTPSSLLPQEAAAVGMSYDDLCAAILEESLKKYERGAL